MDNRGDLLEVVDIGGYYLSYVCYCEEVRYTNQGESLKR